MVPRRPQDVVSRPGSRGFTARIGSAGFPARTGKTAPPPAAIHCGGGVVSASTFRHGGRLTPNLMLGVNPTLGERVKEPGIIPSTTAKLPGSLVSLPAAQSQGFRGNPARAPNGAGFSTTATPSPGSHHPGALPPNSPIVYDPQQDRYLNGNRVMTPQESSASRTGASAPPTPAANSGLIQPVPVGSREPSGRPVESQGSLQPNPTGNSFVRPAPSSPNSNPSGRSSGRRRWPSQWKLCGR